jgi:hypothetical protein
LRKPALGIVVYLAVVFWREVERLLIVPLIVVVETCIHIPDKAILSIYVRFVIIAAACPCKVNTAIIIQ